MNKVREYIKCNFREVLIISIITVFALFLRVLMIKNFGDLWLDELYTWFFADQKTVFDTVIKLIKQDIHMPLYFVILHFWIKIFGSSDVSMHSCTLFLAIPLIPISFYLTKSLFGKTAGYFAAIMFAINTFCIYYSVEVRFYGLVFILALLSAFYFTRMMDKYHKKDFVGFVISHALLIYTFSITGLLTIIYAITAGIYTYKFNRKKLKETAIYFCILLAVSLPAVIAMIFNTISVKSAICSFQKDIYVFSWNVIVDILENFFSSSNFQLLTGNLNHYRSLSDIINSQNFLLIIIPMVIGFVGLYRALANKNKQLYLFLLPSVIFVGVSLILASIGVMSFLTKYSIIVYPVIICSVAYGLTLFKFKPTSVLVFCVFVVLNYTYLLTTPETILSKPRVNLGSLPYVLNNLVKITDKDYVLIPYSGSKVMRYVPRGKFIEFDADDMLLLKDDKSYYFFIGGSAKASRNIIYDYLYDFISKDMVLPYYEQNMLEYINKMEKGSRLILIEYRMSFTHPLINNWNIIKDYETFQKTSKFIIAMSKVILDSMVLGEDYLKPLNYYIDKDADYAIYVYEKQ